MKLSKEDVLDLMTEAFLEGYKTAALILEASKVDKDLIKKQIAESFERYDGTVE